MSKIIELHRGDSEGTVATDIRVLYAQVPADLHNLAKIRAAVECRPLSHLIREAVELYLGRKSA